MDICELIGSCRVDRHVECRNNSYAVPFNDSSGVGEIAVVETKGMLNAVMTVRCFPSTIATKQTEKR